MLYDNLASQNNIGYKNILLLGLMYFLLYIFFSEKLEQSKVDRMVQ